MDILISIALIINVAATLLTILLSKKHIERLTLEKDDLQCKINELKEKVEELECEIYHKF
jgi:hypothetical protein